MIDRDYEPGPFEALYEEWVLAYPEPRDPALARRLADLCRDAWASGQTGERLSVLSFVFDRKDPAHADLIVEGLRSDDQHVASQASAYACASHHGGYFEFGPGFRKEWRDLARRFPENDTFRPREFYGHEPADDDDWQEHPFLNLYEDWRAAEFPGDPERLRRLIDTYRDAWAKGDTIERAFVLHFVSVNFGERKPFGALDGTDLLIEALETQDPVVARTAAFSAWSAMGSGVDLGPRTREILQAHGDRFPINATAIWAALRELDTLEGKRA